MPAALRSKTLAGYCCAFALRATIGKAKAPERRNCLSILNCVIRIFYVQRYKMKIVQYCRMLRKLAILYDIGPIILLPFYLLPFYLFTFLPFHPFTFLPFYPFTFLPFHREYIEFAVDVVVEHPLVDYDMRVERLDGDGMFAHRKICEDGAERLTTQHILLPTL